MGFTKGGEVFLVSVGFCAIRALSSSLLGLRNIKVKIFPGLYLAQGHVGCDGGGCFVFLLLVSASSPCPVSSIAL